LFYFNTVVPRFVVSPPIYHPGYETWDTTITCNIFGYPPPRIEWTRALQDMPEGRYAEIGKALVIKKTEQADKGPYMCKGTNAHGSVFALIVLTVHPVRKYTLIYLYGEPFRDGHSLAHSLTMVFWF
jgi:hypothetical protein